MPPENPDGHATNPYGVLRYDDDGRSASYRIGAMERALSVAEVRISALEGSLKEHLSRASTDAERAAVSATQTLNEIGRLREDLTVIKAMRGSVQVEAVQRLCAILGSLVVVVGAVVGGVIWLTERAG